MSVALQLVIAIINVPQFERLKDSKEYREEQVKDFFDHHNIDGLVTIEGGNQTEGLDFEQFSAFVAYACGKITQILDGGAPDACIRSTPIDELYIIAAGGTGDDEPEGAGYMLLRSIYNVGCPALFGMS